jgi:hypothetical protein
MSGRIRSFLNTLPAAVSAHASTGFGLYPAATKRDYNPIKSIGIHSAGQKRRKQKSEQIPKELKIATARKFGFNKIGVCLSSRLVATLVEGIDGHIYIVLTVLFPSGGPYSGTYEI